MPAPTYHSATNGEHRKPAARERPKLPNPPIEASEQQWLFTPEELQQTPSILDGMSSQEERQLRSKGINFIMQVGVMLKLPQLTLSTASVFFNRFLMRMSLVAKPGYRPLHHYQIAATAIFLATKVEENCRKIKELVVACCRVAQKNPNLLVDEQTKDFWKWRDTILYNEDVLLETICFDLTIESPYKIFFDMMKYYGVEHNKRLRGAGWAFMSDSNHTQLCLLANPRTIAAAALFCSAKLCQIQFPDEDGRPWWEVQHVKVAELQQACNYMVDLYENVAPKDGGESIYVGLRTPPEGLEGFERSRLKSSDDDPPSSSAQTPMSPVTTATTPNTAASLAPAGAGVEQGVKRARDDATAANGDGGAAAADAAPREAERQPLPKRPKTAENGDARAESNGPSQSEEPSSSSAAAASTTAPAAPAVSTTAPAPAPAAAEKTADPSQADDVSEEGEVEE